MATGGANDDGGGSSDDPNTPLHSPRSQNTSREEDDSSNANESDCKSPNQRTKSNQRWMKLRTTVQISSAMQKKPPLKREDSFLKRFSTRQIPETQETVEDTGSEGGAQGDNQSAPRRRRRVRKQPRTVVNPDENFYFHWLLVLTICVLYNMWTLIVRQSFPELQSMISGFWLCCDSISDVVFLLDVGVQLRTGHLEQGLMVYDSKKLACHYLRSRAFLLDLAALCPLDLLQLKLGPHPLLRCPRFLKVYRAVNYYYMVESRTIWPNLWRVVNLIHILLILAHWFGCFYFLLSEAEGFQGDWVYPYRPGDYATLTRKYLGSLYWSTLTLTTIGDLPTPETNAEYIFTIVSYLIGVFIFATIVGQVGNVITNRNANRLEFERLLDGAKTYMRHHKVPGGMKRRVLRWYDYSWSRGRIQGGGDINTALGLLPDKLKTELALHVNLSVLKKVTIFQECQPEFLRDLVLKMKAYIFTPGDSICRKGEVAREMFIIADGILEVLSENGKVLTTMKAGDFFGEIGILNLDGLNKRTADVRSVGYSELFSLSREDVLAAMKDYPEAQEILQALGRKRLMEVKASARHPPHHKEHHHQGTHPDPKGIVDKIKNEAKGLRNALKKTRTHRRSEESLELQPLTSTGNNSKGTLKRMSRVKSHDLSQEDVEKKEQPKPTSEPSTSPLGAGLPLLHRLRLLKEKQENEERNKNSTPPLLSPSSSSIKSPPPIPEESSTSGTQDQIGAGLPLLQRILMLKAREEKAAATSKPSGVVKTPGNGTSSTVALTSQKSGSQPTSPTPVSGEKQPPKITRASFSGVLSARGSISSGGAIKGTVLPLPPKPTAGKISFRERLKLHTSAKSEIPKDSKDIVKEPASQQQTLQTIDPSSISDSVHKVASEQSKSESFSDISKSSEHKSVKSGGVDTPASRLAGEQTAKDPSGAMKTVRSGDISTSDSVTSDSERSEAPWSKLKKAAISRDLSDPSSSITPPRDKDSDSASVNTLTDSSKQQRQTQQVKKPKPSLVLTRKTKHYRSIDDLSPEYGPLPFVKKLKILNERQKLEELETVIKTRSFSLDIPDSQQNIDSDTLTRSQSEGSTMHQDQLRPNKSLLATPLAPSPLHSSTESNETPERRNLKSILKKLSEDTQQKDQQVDKPVANLPEKRDSMEFRKLMRAPTIEGYAARHSKLSKSVTFNRDTLQSPPNSANLLLGGGEPPKMSVFPFVNNTTDNGYDIDLKEQEKRLELERCGIQTHRTNQMRYMKTPLDDDQQYFADILLAIKQVMSSHFQDMQEKFVHRFEKLEEEVRSRDEIINQLKAHIAELEKSNDDYSYEDSADTVISIGGRGEQQSWEEPSNIESEELQEIPHHPLTPHHVWSSSSENVVLDIDSPTDTDSDLGDSSEQEHGGYESAEFENSSHNWEIELLAQQIRQRRSASLDHSSGRPLRKRFTRGGSADARND